MATDSAYRGRGIGKRVLWFAEKAAARRGATKIILHSRPEAAAFYENCGYVYTGNYEEHDGMNDPEMVKSL